jgi:hypothetical protein
MTRVDPTWFETPVERIDVSGGTAPFFRLVLSEKGVRECNVSLEMTTMKTFTVLD